VDALLVFGSDFSGFKFFEFIVFNLVKKWEKRDTRAETETETAILGGKTVNST